MRRPEQIKTSIFGFRVALNGNSAGPNRNELQVNLASVSRDLLRSLPSQWQGGLRSDLEEGESILAVFHPDLDRKLWFSEGLIVLLSRQILSIEPTSSDNTTDLESSKIQTWNIADSVDLQVHEQNGICTIELLGADPSQSLAI